VGTGGRSLTALDPNAKSATQVRENTTYGVLKLTLHGPGPAHPSGWYQWAFVGDGQSGSFTDSGSGDCVEPPKSPGGPGPGTGTGDGTAATSPSRSGTGPAPATRTERRIAARVTRVVDGDTIRARAIGGKRRRYTVRLLGIDAPQRKPAECGSSAARRKLIRLAFVRRKGRRVTLIIDPALPTRDRRGRLLAYVKRRDGVNLARSQLRAGWARVWSSPRRFRLLRRFRALERRAWRAKRGAWGRCDGDFHRRSPARG
jgi:endonuclease YncB( thermonuclease family)